MTTVTSPSFRTAHIAVDVLGIYLMASRVTEDIQDVFTVPGQTTGVNPPQ
jgi:hypothetical protein